MISELFYSFDAEKQTLHRRITPSKDQRDEQKERWNHLAEYLIKDLEERSGCKITSLLQGSYNFGTQIRPRVGQDFDIDLGMYFHWSDHESDDLFNEKELKAMVQASLHEYTPEDKSDEIEVLDPAKNRCSRIKFDNGFHIDVPAYHFCTDNDMCLLATEEDGWETSDPQAILDWFREKLQDDDERFLVRRLIRYYKAWATLHFEENEQPSSLLLTTIITEAYEADGDLGFANDNLHLQNINEAILQRLENDSEVPNPVAPEEDLNRLAENFDGFVAKLRTLNDQIQSANSAEGLFEAVSVWEKVFLHFFPVPDVGEEKGLIPASFVPEVDVNARCKKNTNLSFSGKNKIGVIPKGCSIDFSITNTEELPQGAVITWTARNEGEEAEYENDMGHPSGEGASTTDNSAYQGSHYMDVMIKSQFGSVLGFRRIPVIISGYDCPERNPKRRARYPKNKKKR
jgi:hypothetical protein